GRGRESGNGFNASGTHGDGHVRLHEQGPRHVRGGEPVRAGVAQADVVRLEQREAGGGRETDGHAHGLAGGREDDGREDEERVRALDGHREVARARAHKERERRRVQEPGGAGRGRGGGRD
ncbi:hypothetical protein EG859_15455, partial [Enterococcus faecalis]